MATTVSSSLPRILTSILQKPVHCSSLTSTITSLQKSHITSKPKSHVVADEEVRLHMEALERLQESTHQLQEVWPLLQGLHADTTLNATSRDLFSKLKEDGLLDVRRSWIVTANY